MAILLANLKFKCISPQYVCTFDKNVNSCEHKLIESIPLKTPIKLIDDIEDYKSIMKLQDGIERNVVEIVRLR